MTLTDPTPSTAPSGTRGYRFLQDNFAPVDTEVTVTALEVEGAIPPGLSGRYVRTGPNPIHADEDAYHWFLGDGMLHGLRLDGGRAEWYRNRWVRTSGAAGALGESFVMPRAEGGIYEGMGNTNVVHHDGRVWAITEGALPIEIGPHLETVASHNFGGPLVAGINAHPKFDPRTNELHAMSYAWFSPHAYYQVISADGRVTRSEAIDVGGPVMIHDMALTERYAVAFDLPVVFDFSLVEAGSRMPYRWDREYTPRIGLVRRDGTAADTTWITLEESLYVYHVLNSYDLADGTGRLVIDLVVHPRAFDDQRGDPSQGEPVLERWTVDPAKGNMAREIVDQRGQEFPRADERRAGLPYRFGYSVGARELAALGGAADEAEQVNMLKHDLQTGTTKSKSLGGGVIPGEMVFVPSGPGASEDEGWLLGYAFDRARGASDLVILDAHDWDAAPIAIVHLPVRVPVGFHGNWIPDDSLTR